MAKKRGETENQQVRQLSQIEQEYVIANWKNKTVQQLANETNSDPDTIKVFLEGMKTSGGGKSRGAFINKTAGQKRSGVTIATDVASGRGDEAAKNAKRNNFNQFKGSIFRPLGGGEA